MNKILITGGAGFIGSHLVEYFLNKNYIVHIFDNFLTGFKKNIPNNKKCFFHKVDVNNFELISKIMIKDCIPKYLLLSNIEHVSLPNMTKFESENMNFQNIYINNNNYIYVGELTRKKYKVNTYKIKN